MIQVHERLSNLIESKTGVRPASDDTLDVMKIDSLAMAELTVEIENTFGIRIDEDVLEVHNFDGLVEYVARKAAGRIEASPESPSSANTPSEQAPANRESSGDTSSSS